MLTIPNYIPDAVVPLNTKQEAAMVEIVETDPQGGSYHFSQQVSMYKYYVFARST